jgi:hypothetical protein
MNAVSHVEKGDQFRGGNAGNFNFRGVDRVVNALSAAIRGNGLVIVPDAVEIPEYKAATTSSGAAMNYARVHVRYTITGPEGDIMHGSAVGEASDRADKAVSKAMSVAWRTFLIQTFFLPTDEPDPDSEVNPAVVTDRPSPRQQAAAGVMQHWEGRAQKCTSLEQLQALYNEAMAQKAGPDVLTMIQSYDRSGK